MESTNYRKAVLSDAKSISHLNYSFYQAFILGDKDKGFLKNNFSIEEIESLIKASEIVVAEINSCVIGYYLTNSIHINETIEKRKKIIDELIENGEIPNGKYVYLTQAVVDKPFMQKGIAKELLKHLKTQVSAKFDFLIGFIDVENLNAKEAHLKSGWNIISPIESGYLAMTRTEQDNGI